MKNKPQQQSEVTIADKIAYRELERFYKECYFGGAHFDTLNERELRVLKGSIEFENWKFQEAVDALVEAIVKALKPLGEWLYDYSRERANNAGKTVFNNYIWMINRNNIYLHRIRIVWPLSNQKIFCVINRMGVSGPALKPFGFFI